MHCKSRRQRRGNARRYTDDDNFIGIGVAPSTVVQICIEPVGRLVDVELNGVQMQCASLGGTKWKAPFRTPGSLPLIFNLDGWIGRQIVSKESAQGRGYGKSFRPRGPRWW